MEYLVHDENHGVYQVIAEGSIYHRFMSQHRTNLELDLIKYYDCGDDDCDDDDCDDEKLCAIFPSGINAIYNAIDVSLPENGKLLSSADIYGDTICMCESLAKKKHAIFIPINIYDDDELMRTFDKHSDANVFYFESASNPEGKMINHDLLRTIRERYHHLTIVVDNTWLSGCSYNPMKYGVNIVVESLTKYIGACNYMGGMALGDAELIKKIKTNIRIQGLHVFPMICMEFSNGLITVEERIEKIGVIACCVAVWLDNDPRVHSVLHISLPSHPSYAQLTHLKYFPGVMYFQIITNRSYENQQLIDIIRGAGIPCGPSYGSTFAKINPWISCTLIGGTSQFSVWLRLALGSQTDTDTDFFACLEKLLNVL